MMESKVIVKNKIAGAEPIYPGILKELSETVLSLKEMVATNLTMKQKEALKKAGKEPEYDLNSNVIVPRYECVTSHTARRTGIANMRGHAT